MASATLIDHGFPNGTTVEVFPAHARAGSGPPSGAAVTSAVVTNGALVFQGLSEDLRYIAYALGRAVGFMARPGLSEELEGPPAGLLDRVEDLERLSSSVERSLPYVSLGTYALAGIPGQQSGFDAAVNALVDGGTLLVPDGAWHVARPRITKRINIIGSSAIGAAFIVSGPTSEDGFVYDTGALTCGVTLRDFAVYGGASACRYGFVARNLVDSTIDVCLKAGGTHEFSIEGLLVCNVRLRCPGNNYVLPYTPTRSTNGGRVGYGREPSNANKFDLTIEALTGDGVVQDATQITGTCTTTNGSSTITSVTNTGGWRDGMTITGTGIPASTRIVSGAGTSTMVLSQNCTASGSGVTISGPSGNFNNDYRGTIQGITGKPIHIVGSRRWSISKMHLEASGIATIENCGPGDIGPGIAYTDGTIALINSDDVTLDGVTVNTLTIDSACDRTDLGSVYYTVLTDNGVGTTSRGRLVDVTGATKSRALPGSPETNNLLPSDGIRKWDTTPKPLGSTISPGTVTKTGDGQADTRKLFPPFAALIQGASAVYFENVTVNEVEQCKGNHVTFTAWVYIPSGQANQPTVVIEANIVGGLGTVTGQSTAATDAWTRLSITVPVDTASTGVNLKLRNTVALTGDWYISGTSCVLGRTGPRSRPDRVVPKRYAELTWDPASLAAGAVANQNVTVQGCALGDKADCSFSLGTGNGQIFTARVVAANTVQVTLMNMSGGVLDLGSGTLRVWTESPS